MRKALLTVSFILLLCFGLLSKYEDRPSLRSLDFAVTVKVQDAFDKSSRLRLSEVMANAMEGATVFASPEFTVLVTLLFTAVSIYDWKKKRWRLLAVMIPVALVLLVGIEVAGKSVVHHPAPPFSMIKNPASVFPADYVNEQYSYPSGHAARAVFISIIGYGVFVLLKTHRSRTTNICMIGSTACYVVAVLASRVYLGHHWLSDVIGGVLVGSSMGTLALSGIWKQNE